MLRCWRGCSVGRQYPAPHRGSGLGRGMAEFFLAQLGPLVPQFFFTFGWAVTVIKRAGPTHATTVMRALTTTIIHKKLISSWDRRTLPLPLEPCHHCKTLPPLYSTSLQYLPISSANRIFFLTLWLCWLLCLINTLTYLLRRFLLVISMAVL